MSGKNDIGNVVAGIATCAVMIYVAIQIVNDLLENEPFYRYLLLIALSFIASVISRRMGDLGSSNGLSDMMWMMLSTN